MASVMFHMSDNMKAALDMYCGGSKTISEVIRQAVATQIGYDMEQEKRTRRSKYRSQEAKQAHYNEIARNRRALARALEQEQDADTIESYRQALKESLK